MIRFAVLSLLAAAATAAFGQVSEPDPEDIGLALALERAGSVPAEFYEKIVTSKLLMTHPLKGIFVAPQVLDGRAVNFRECPIAGDDQRFALVDPEWMEVDHANPTCDVDVVWARIGGEGGDLEWGETTVVLAYPFGSVALDVAITAGDFTRIDAGELATADRTGRIVGGMLDTGGNLASYTFEDADGSLLSLPADSIDFEADPETATLAVRPRDLSCYADPTGCFPVAAGPPEIKAENLPAAMAAPLR
jgi:hypothetical protein